MLGPVYAREPVPTLGTGPAALLQLAEAMAPNSWREVPSLLLGNGGTSYGWRGPQLGLFPTPAQINARDEAWGSLGIYSLGPSGPWGGLDAGCSMAFDPATWCIYLPGMGGHDTYAGNEVYQFDLKTLTARVDCEASPLTVRHVTDPINGGDVYGDGPVAGPCPAHTWEGVLWDFATSKVLYLAALGTFGIHARSGTKFEPTANPTFYTGVRPVNVAYTVSRNGWQGGNFPCTYDPGTRSWTRLVSDLTDPRCLTGYYSMLAYDSNRGRVGGFCPTSGAGGIASKLGYWDRAANTWTTYGLNNVRLATGQSAHGTILYHPGDDKFYWVNTNLATGNSLWLASAPADGSAVMTYVVELPRRVGAIVSPLDPAILQTCPADQTIVLDPATRNEWYSLDIGLCYCSVDNAIYCCRADGYGQVWRLAHPYAGQTWQALSPGVPWPYNASMNGSTPWIGPHHDTQIFNRWQYICQSIDNKALFILILSFSGTWIYKGA